MILVDTSVLTNFLKGKENAQVRKFEDVIEKKIPFGITYMIYQELIQGADSKKEFDLIDEYLKTQLFYELKNGLESYRNGTRIFFNCRRNGITIRSTADLLIAQTAIDNDYFCISQIEDQLKLY